MDEDGLMGDEQNKLVGAVKLLDIKKLAGMDYDGIKKELALFLERGKKEGLELDYKLLYNEKTGLIKIDIIRKN